MKLEKIQRGSKTYLRIRFRHEGVNHILSLGRMTSPDDYQAAIEIRDALRDEIRSGSFDDNLEKYKRKQITTTRSLAEAVKALPIVHLKESAINHANRYGPIRTRKQAKDFIYSLPVKSHGVRRRYLRIYQKANPALFGEIKITEKDPPSDPIIFTRGQLQDFVHDIRDNDPDYFALFLCLVETGMRPSECLALNVADFNYHRGTLRIDKAVTRKGTVKSTKNRKIRTIIAPKALKETLSNHLFYNRVDPSGSDPLILSPLGDRHIYETVRYHFRASLKRIGLHSHKPPFDLYTLRRTYITQLIRTKKLDVGTVAKIAGNSPGVIFKNYLGAYQQETPIELYENIYSDLDIEWFEDK